MAAVIVIMAAPLPPAPVAVTVTWPAASAITRPFGLTVSSAGLLLAQVTVPMTGFPIASVTVAVNCRIFDRTHATSVEKVLESHNGSQPSV